MGPKEKEPEELPENPILCSFDPGGTTGWSVLHVHAEALADPDIPILSNVLHWAHGQLVGPENEQASQILGIIAQWPGCAVLFEDFVLRVKSGDRDLLSPVRITAKVEYGLFLAGTQEIYKQMPSEAKSVATDDRLKSWGFYQREGGLEHARDADRHGLSWLRKCKQHSWLRARCWPYLYGPGGEFAAGTTTEGEEDELA
jgi:hypothetical protein